jgi:hypothetical protein
MPSIQQDTLWDHSNEQAANHIQECRGDSNWYTPSRGRTWQHVVRLTPNVSRTTTVHEFHTRSKSPPCSRDEVLAPTYTQSGRHPRLPHSPSNKPPQSREVWFDKVVTGLLGLLGPIKAEMRLVQIKACHRGQNDVVLNQNRWELPPWNLRIATTLSPAFSFWVLHRPLDAPPGHDNIITTTIAST